MPFSSPEKGHGQGGIPYIFVSRARRAGGQPLSANRPVKHWAVRLINDTRQTRIKDGEISVYRDLVDLPARRL